MTETLNDAAADPQQIIAEIQRKLAERTAERDELLQQQTATAEVLKSISQSAFDLQSVLQTLVESARRLLSTDTANIYLRDGDVLRVRVHTGMTEDFHKFLQERPAKAERGRFIGRAFLTAEVVHLPDVLADPEYSFPGAPQLGGYRAVLGVPMVRNGLVEGVFGLGRSTPGPFTGREIELVRTFADQALIAIENARLFNETKEALERQTATAEVLQVISSSPGDLKPVFDQMLAKAMRLCEAQCGFIYQMEQGAMRAVAEIGVPPAFAEYRRNNLHTGGAATPADMMRATRKPAHVHDARDSEPYRNGNLNAVAGVDLGGARTVLYVPMIRNDDIVGVINVYRQEVKPFTVEQISLLENFASQAVIAIENARLFNETQEALERQTATADILKVIASSPSDLQPVFEAIAERSNRLVNGLSTTVLSIVDDTIHLSAFTRTNPQADAALTASFPIQLSTTPFSELIRQGAIYSLPDTETEPAVRDLARMRGYRSMLFVPLLRDGAPIGMIGQTRVEPGPFAVNHIQLLKTFADQAGIAISNVRLFQEVRERTRELSQSLDDLRTAQDRLVQTEKLASLGQLTAGIAHEIKNPLNFVNNFSALSVELIDEMTDIFENPALDEAARRKELDEIRELLKSNLEKVVQHGKRADSIVKNMLLHSREGSGEQRAVDINKLLEESLNLAYHGARAEKPGFNIALRRDLDPDAGAIDVFPQEITRAFINLISNGFYAASKRKAENGEAEFEPVLSAATKNLGNHVEIRIRDNGTGIPSEVKEKIFNPFFTTKPAGEGTGLGLSMSHDIVVKQHGGTIDVDSESGIFTEFIITLPRTIAPQKKAGGTI